MMKTIRNIMRLMALVMMIPSVLSCHGDLDIIQDNKLSYSNMWKDATDVLNSTVGIYRRMRSNFAQNEINVFYWGEVRVGNYMWGPSLESNVQNNNMIECRESRLSSTTESTSWSSLYSAIDQANAVIKYAQLVKMTESEYGYAMGQASFARAYCYFWAARMWGDVPLVLVPIESTTQPETYPERAPKSDVYAQIGKDIETALEYAKHLGTNKYFATEDAVNMLRAEWALWMYANQNGGDTYLSIAEDALAAIGISSNKLLDNYNDIFLRTNKVNKEVVFALFNDQGEKLLGGYHNFFHHPANLIAEKYRQNPVPIIATQWWSFSEEFCNVLRNSKINNGDKRVDKNLGDGDYGAAGQNITWCNKFLGDMSGGVSVLDCDLLYYRYALAIMMHAELKYYQKDYVASLKSLNLIAKRAYGKDEFYVDASKDAVLKALIDEYFLEFPAEGVIWWALIRLDKIWDYNPSLKDMAASNKNILLWPISASARNKNNKLYQTEGWS